MRSIGSTILVSELGNGDNVSSASISSSSRSSSSKACEEVLRRETTMSSFSFDFWLNVAFSSSSWALSNLRIFFFSADLSFFARFFSSLSRAFSAALSAFAFAFASFLSAFSCFNLFFSSRAAVAAVTGTSSSMLLSTSVIEVDKSHPSIVSTVLSFLSINCPLSTSSRSSSFWGDDVSFTGGCSSSDEVILTASSSTSISSSISNWRLPLLRSTGCTRI